MKYVLDASAAIKQVIVEPDSDKVIQLIDDFANGIHELIAPDLFPTECGNVLMILERKGTILKDQAASHFQDIINNGPVIFRRRRSFRGRSRSLSSTGRASTTACMSLWPSGRRANSSRRTINS
jgi:hypothetical protein